MMQSAHAASQFTFVAQGVLFPFLLVSLLYIFWRSLRIDGEIRAWQRAFQQLPPLTPSRCAGCGTGVPWSHTATACPGCHLTVDAAPSDPHRAKLVSEARARLTRASRHARWAVAMSSPSFRAGVWILLAWLVFTAVARLASDVAASSSTPWSWIALTFWILVALIVGFSLRAEAPGIRRTHIGASADAAVAECATCTGRLEYGPRDLATACGYCGSESQRAFTVPRPVAMHEHSAFRVTPKPAAIVLAKPLEDILFPAALLLFGASLLGLLMFVFSDYARDLVESLLLAGLDFMEAHLPRGAVNAILISGVSLAVVVRVGLWWLGRSRRP